MLFITCYRVGNHHYKAGWIQTYIRGKNNLAHRQNDVIMSLVARHINAQGDIFTITIFTITVQENYYYTMIFNVMT